jgi:hypothetical protein
MSRISVVVITSLLITGAISAQTCDVTIQGAPGTHYSSVKSALAAMPGGGRMFVSGICQEKIEILNRVGLTIEGRPGARLEPPPGNTERHPQTLMIRVSDNITVQTLTVRGTPNITGAVSVWQSRRVEFRDVTIENGGNEGGVWVVESFGVTLTNALIQNNGNGNGIRVDGPASVGLVGAWIPGTIGTTIVQNNATGARTRNGGVLALRGDTVIRDNGTGIATDGGDLSVCCAEDIAHPRVENNRGTGIILRGGDAGIQGPLTVQDNGSFGFVVFGTDTRVTNTIVRRNGVNRSPAGSGGGVVVLSGRLDWTGGEITDNGGPGLVLSEGAHGRTFSMRISGNNGEGIDAQMLSVVGVAFNTIVEDNKGFDFRCSPNSHAHGSKEGVARMQCPGFNNGPDPTPGD